MLGIAPIITPLFAMKGGTALNLFLQEMPRLSVDIDVVVKNPKLTRHEVLFNHRHSMAGVYESDFVGMTIETVGLDVLEATQERPHRELPTALTEPHRQFLISLLRTEPDWSLMPYKHLSKLPPIRWKLINLEKLRKNNPALFEKQEALLREGFAAIDSGKEAST
ncbi:Nucleotidyl transferase AbiEii toxin, Type IV TA system [Paraburkholderia phenazinium]|uniref:Nucleotidyl transferase AbiEii toxin, Type IV TA system n=2 Tax=Burkholderiaceae TaxID=119060 RepID=A0A1N6JR53_9BURK|nr:Nucleotidyl transferase AbiEii toxin, Type IV TA system [Paraburkholderia phenazinium]